MLRNNKSNEYREDYMETILKINMNSLIYKANAIESPDSEPKK